MLEILNKSFYLCSMIGWLRHIEYLLLHNDRVAVPGLGCFEVIHHEARLLPDGCSMLPPTRSIAFVAGEGQENELLVRSWMRARFISHDDACTDIANGVATLRQQLDNEQRCELGRLGALVESDGVIVFQSSRENRLEYPRFGLAPLTIIPSSERVEVEEPIAMEAVEAQSSEKNPDRIYISFSRRFARVASVAAAVIVFLLMVSQPINTPDTMSHYAGVLSAELFAQSDEPVMNELWEPLAVAETAVEESAKVELVQTSAPIAAPEVETVVPAKKGNYYIIVASLPNRRLAETQIECFRQQGITCELMINESPNKARLYVASFDKIGAAKEYLAQLVKEQTIFANAWIMKDAG